jgi:hypothetical protein
MTYKNPFVKHESSPPLPIQMINGERWQGRRRQNVCMQSASTGATMWKPICTHDTVSFPPFAFA